MFVIGIAGGTCSGKSTLSQALAAYYGERCQVIHMDAYFRSPAIRTIAPITGIEYVEHNLPESLELDRLYADFETAVQEKKTDVLVIEGLFALHLPEIRQALDLKIFVDLPSDERLVRRIRRFTAAGQTFDEVTARYLDTVRFRHNELVEPSRWFADMVVNGNAGCRPIQMIQAYVDAELAK